MNIDPTFDPDDKSGKAFFEQFMAEVTPPREIEIFASNGAALIFKPVDAAEFRKLQAAAKPFIETQVIGRGLKEDWKPYRIKDAGEAFKVFFLWSTMIGWHAKSKIVQANGEPLVDGEELPDGAKRVADGPRLDRWDQKGWLWYASQSPVSFKAVEAFALQAQATGTAAAQVEEVERAGEDSSGTS